MYGTNGWSWDSQQQQQPIVPQIQPFRTSYSMNMPKFEVIKVNGKAGAENFRMAPNSSALLLDNTAPIVWYVQTDGAGYLTAAPFDITPHQTPKPVDMNDLSARVTKLEELIANVQQSNIGTTKQSKKQRQQSTVATTADVDESANHPTV